MARTDHLVAGIALALVATLVPACAQDPTPETETPASAKPIGLSRTEIVASLHALAVDTSKRWGVEAPAAISAVAAADHQAAESVVSGALVYDHSPVYVVQVTGGTFTARRHPVNVEPPRGQVLTITFDAATLRVTDVGIDAVAPDLARIDSEVVDLQGMMRAP